jgi:hypothetical protein
VYGLAVQESGATIFGGHFNRVQGATHRNLALYQPDAPATASLEVDATRQIVTWNRSGNSPELESAIFEQSADGTNYSRLGFGTRIFGGWQIRDLTLPPDPITIRARGRTLSGVGNRSAGIVSISADL